MRKKVYTGINGKLEWRYKRMPIRNELSTDTAEHLLSNVTNEIKRQQEEHWLKKQFWKWFPFALLLVFAVIAILMMGRQ